MVDEESIISVFYISIFLIKFKQNLVYTYVFFLVTMPMSIFLTYFSSSWHSMIFFIKLRVFLLQTKILLKLLRHFFAVIFLIDFWVDVVLTTCYLIKQCHHLSLMIGYPILFFSSMCFWYICFVHNLTLS